MAVTVEMHTTSDSDVKADVVASIEHALVRIGQEIGGF